MTTGPQLGAGIGSQPGGFATQGAQSTAPSPATPASGSSTGGASTTIAPGGFGSSTSATTDARSSAPSPSAQIQAPPPQTASPILIDVPAAPATASAPVSGANATGISDGAFGVVVEGMMLSDVVDVDRERSCITLRSPDGTRASYRFTSASADRMVAVGDQVVIEMVRPLLASASDAPSASPRMSGRNRDAETAAATGAAANHRSKVSTIISPLHHPGGAISTTGERCERSGTQPG